MRIALFVPCFNDALFPGTAMATVRLFRRLGHEVEFPADQTCCGQIHFNTGYRTEARRLALRFLKVFGDAEVVVAPSASCVAMIREHYGEVVGVAAAGRRIAEPGRVSPAANAPAADAPAANAPAADAVRSLASRTYELSEFLVRVLGVEDVGAAFPHRVALHPTCHSIRGIDVGDAPLRLLRAVRGLELVDLPNAEACCGFGGTFSVKNAHTSLAMMDDKIRDVLASGADVLTAVDNSCLMHLAGGLHRKGLLGNGPPAARAPGGAGQGRGRSTDDGQVADGGARRTVRLLHLAEILADEEGGRR